MRSPYHPEVDDPRVVFVVEPRPAPHPSDSWRLSRPSFEMLRRGYNVELLTADRAEAIPDARPDVVVIARQTANPERFADFVEAMHVLYKSAVILDWDDTPNFHPVFHKATEWETRAEDGWKCVGSADAVTGTTPDHVAHLAERAKRVAWTPNLIAPEMWAQNVPTTRPKHLTIGVMGSSSHDDDWKSVLPDLWPRLAAEYPDLHFVVVGFRPDWLMNLVPRERLHDFGWTGLEDYPQLCKFIDIGLCPLTDIEFNRMKSPIKWMEYTLAGAAVVASPTMYRTWINPGTTGFIARTPDEWYRATSHLIENPDTRQNLRVNAAREVLTYHTFSDERCRLWMNVYRDTYRGVFGNDRPINAAYRSDGVGESGVRAGQGNQHSSLALPGTAGFARVQRRINGDGGRFDGRPATGGGPHQGHADGDSAKFTRLSDIPTDGPWLDGARLELWNQYRKKLDA